MSKLVNMDSLLFVGNDIYESDLHLALGWPLDTGRLTYAKMRAALSDLIPIEVIWNHFKNEVTVVVGAGRQNEYSYMFKVKPMARVQRLEFIDDLVRQAKEAEPFLLLQS
jgi:hypothetical protein